MARNAIAVSNYFIDLAKKDNSEIKLLGLVKRVYIAHGFCLALYGKSFLDDRFDSVEAWRYGPVIPSVYHSFKYNRANPITDHAYLYDGSEFDEENFVPPSLNPLYDQDIMDVCEMVWIRYKEVTDSDLVFLTHKDGTPWSICYVANENRPIPDKYTTEYYKKVVQAVIKRYKDIA